jgi:hypothetical protein
MRTAQRDQSGLVTFTGAFASGPSGSGVAYPGVPYTFTRTGTGAYTIRFDAALQPLTVVCTTNSGQIALAAVGPGLLQVGTYNTTGAAFDGSVHFTITARRMG